MKIMKGVPEEELGVDFVIQCLVNVFYWGCKVTTNLKIKVRKTKKIIESSTSSFFSKFYVIPRNCEERLICQVN